MGRLKKGDDFKCRNCSEGGVKVVDEIRQFVLEAREELEVVDKYCYLGDVIGKGGGAEEADDWVSECRHLEVVGGVRKGGGE